jgi:hypothetical protein
MNKRQWLANGVPATWVRYSIEEALVLAVGGTAREQVRRTLLPMVEALHSAFAISTKAPFLPSYNPATDYIR